FESDFQYVSAAGGQARNSDRSSFQLLDLRYARDHIQAHRSRCGSKAHYGQVGPAENAASFSVLTAVARATTVIDIEHGDTSTGPVLAQRPSTEVGRGLQERQSVLRWRLQYRSLRLSKSSPRPARW